VERRRRQDDPVERTLRLDDTKPFQEEVAKSVRAHYRPCVVVMSGARVGEKIVIEGTAMVGRNPEAEVHITDKGVSWEHAHIEDRAGSWAVVDMGSTNGTLVNGERVTDKVLVHGDKIVFGATMVRFDVQDAADQAFDEMVARLLNVDDLTGLYLRRRFDTELRMMIHEASATGQPLGMLVMDLDGIKSINDAHGHAFGAHTIAEAGRVIGRVLEGRGIACRWGGDEFLAALPNADLDGAVAIGEEIHEAIAKHAFEKDGIVLSPGISIGASSYPAEADDAEKLFRCADDAMYRAKRAGKNRVSR
jgi:diguanylate cyclase (GGDEF)-like protein